MPPSQDKQEVWENAIRVGYLTGEQRYSVGEAWKNKQFLEAMWILFRKASIADGCVEFCYECSMQGEVLCMHNNDERILLGFSFAAVYSETGQVFFASDMILHYVVAHRYQPSDEFIDTVLKWKGIVKEEYWGQLKRWGLRIQESKENRFTERQIQKGEWPATPRAMPIRHVSLFEM